MGLFANRLRNARKMAGYSLQELSDNLNGKISKQDLSRLETGESEPEFRILDELCLALGVSLDYFKRNFEVDLNTVEFRKLKKLPAKESEKVKALTAEFLERYLELENLMGIDNRLPFEPYSYKVKGIEDIEQAAQSLRALLQIGNDPIYNLVSTLENSNIKVFKVIENTGFSGLSTIVDNKIAIIVLNDNPELPVVRKRFTALHELGHLYLDLADFSDKEKEKYCDVFASAVLLPAEKLKLAFGGYREKVYAEELRIIKNEYGISLPAIMYRACQLELISESHLKFFSVRYNQYHKKYEKEGYDIPESSNRFLQLIIRAIAQEIISSSKGASLYNQRLNQFRRTILES